MMKQQRTSDAVVFFRSRIKDRSIEELLAVSAILKRDAQDLHDEMEAVNSNLLEQRIARIKLRYALKSGNEFDSRRADL